MLDIITTIICCVVLCSSLIGAMVLDNRAKAEHIKLFTELLKENRN